MSEKPEENITSQEQPESIDFQEWLKLRPDHISEEEWPLRVAELKEMLESPSVKTEDDRSKLILGWKVKNGLLPEQK